MLRRGRLDLFAVGALSAVSLFTGEVAVGETLRQGGAQVVCGEVRVTGAVHGDEDPRVLLGIDLHVGVEHVGVPAVADDPVAVALLLEEAQGHLRAAGQAAEALLAQGGLVHQGDRFGLQHTGALGGLHVHAHELGHVGHRRCQRPRR